MKINSDRSKVFFRFLASYFIILLISVVIASFVFYEVVDTMEKDARNSSLSILNQTKEVMNEKLRRIDSFIFQMNWNSQIRCLLEDKNPKEKSIYNIREVYTEIAPYLSNQEEFYIYFKNINTLISPRGSYSKLKLLYGEIIKYGDMDYETFYNEILNKYYFKKILPARQTILGEKKGSKILCIQSLPMETKNSFQGNLLYFIDENMIHSLMKNQNVDEGSFSYIKDEDGNVITYLGHADKDSLEKYLNYNFKNNKSSYINDKDMIISYTVSDYNNWTYVTVLPKKIVLQKAYHIKQLIIFSLLLYVLIGSLIAYVFAYKNFKPIKEVVAQLKGKFNIDDNDCRDEYIYLKNNITKLINNNEELHNAVQSQIPIIKDSFMEKLLRGEYNNLIDIEQLLKQVGIDTKDNNYCVLIIHFCDYFNIVNREIVDELGVKRVITKKVIEQVLDINNIQVDIDVDKIALVIYFNDSNNTDNLEFRMKKLSQILLSNYNINVVISGGNIFNNLLDISYSYFQAIEAIDNKTINNDETIIWYNKILRNSNKYYYSIEFENRLINFTKAGDEKQISNLFEILYKENFSERNLNAEMTWQLFNEVRATLYKVINQKNIDNNDVNYIINEINYMFKSGDIEHIFSKIKNGFLIICSYIHENKKSHNNQMKIKIIDIIENSYRDSNFGLGYIAGNLKMSEAYLSQFFKEQMGQNFSTYIENKRINTSIEMLKNNKTSINDIAISVGYNSSHAFRRAFKKVTGVVPSAYRKA